MKIVNIFRDKKGKVVIAQKPNLPLWIAIFFFLIKFIPLWFLSVISFWGVTISLLYWSYLELTDGINLWRRFLGFTVALLQLFGILKLL